MTTTPPRSAWKVFTVVSLLLLMAIAVVFTTKSTSAWWYRRNDHNNNMMQEEQDDDNNNSNIDDDVSSTDDLMGMSMSSWVHGLKLVVIGKEEDDSNKGGNTTMIDLMDGDIIDLATLEGGVDSSRALLTILADVAAGNKEEGSEDDESLTTMTTTTMKNNIMVMMVQFDLYGTDPNVVDDHDEEDSTSGGIMTLDHHLFHYVDRHEPYAMGGNNDDDGDDNNNRDYEGDENDNESTDNVVVVTAAAITPIDSTTASTSSATTANMVDNDNDIDNSYYYIPVSALTMVGMYELSIIPYHHEESAMINTDSNNFVVQAGMKHTMTFQIIDTSSEQTETMETMSMDYVRRGDDDEYYYYYDHNDKVEDSDSDSGNMDEIFASAQADDAIISGFVLINGDTGEEIAILEPGTYENVIDLSMYGMPSSLSVRAITNSNEDSTNSAGSGGASSVSSIAFDFGDRYVDDIEPYTMDNTKRLALNGKHTVTATAYPKTKARGREQGQSIVTIVTTGSTIDPCMIDAPTIKPETVDTDVPAYTANTTGSINGELRKWHKITIGFIGPDTCERAQPNPFTYYRLDVTFNYHGNTDDTHSTSTTSSTKMLHYIVPGYYATDGNSANTGATSGNVWLVHFTPDQIGLWTWSARFTKGTNVYAQEDGVGVGMSAGYFDGSTGSFFVEPTNKIGRDHRSKGRLQYVNLHHLQYAETGDYFLKVGADSPENFLAYEDFDNTYNIGNYRKTWSLHKQDYNTGNPTWMGGKGTGIIGAVNYLSEQNMNVFSFLPFSAGNGDDKNIFPFVSASSGDDQLCIDVSKTAQWEVLFEHADHMGMYLHFKTQEQENDQFMDNGELGLQRKLYYRELIARFSHHLALNWNIGEENTNTAAQRIAFSNYFEENDPYNHIVVIHTGKNVKESIYPDLLGLSTFDGASLQSYLDSSFNDTIRWVKASANAGKKWVVAVDETGFAGDGVLPDIDDPNHDNVRKAALWGNIMAGGAGVEYYFGYHHPNSDLTCQDFRSRANMWKQSWYALDFFTRFEVPFWTMSNENELVSNDNWCLVDPSYEILVLYLPNGGSVSVDLPSPSGTSYSVTWYDPRNGGNLQYSTMTTVTSGESVSLGSPPSAIMDDWVVLLVMDDGDGPLIPPAVQPDPDPQGFGDPTRSPQPTHSPETGPSETFSESDGLIVMEMESPKLQRDWVFERMVIGYTGDGYLRMDGNSVYTGDPNGRTSFYIKVNNPGKYRLALRSNKNNEDETLSNDCYTKMVGHSGYKGNDTKTYMYGPSGTWSWSTTHQLSHDDHRTPFYKLDVGIHELQISGRSKNFFIDRVVLYNTVMYNWNDAIDITNPESQRLDNGGSYPAAMPSGSPVEGFSLTSLVLVGTVDMEDIEILTDGSVFDIVVVGKQLSVRADTIGAVGSVVFDLDSVQAFKVENTPEYYLDGNAGNVAYPVVEVSEIGQHTLSATVYSDRDGAGIAGNTISVSFTILDSSTLLVLGFVLIDANTGSDQFVIEDGDEIDLGVYGEDLNILAITSGSIGSIRFGLDDVVDFRVEGKEPYALGGDISGDYNVVDELKVPGSHTVTATPYSGSNGEGIEGNSVSLSFTIVG